jgi:hypothetical protein
LPGLKTRNLRLCPGFPSICIATGCCVIRLRNNTFSSSSRCCSNNRLASLQKNCTDFIYWRGLNAGNNRFFREAFDLYRAGLEEKHLLEDGMVSRFTYHNVVAIGLWLGELEWVRYFIGEYKNRLEKRYRESSFSYNLARLEYESGHHGYVLELLQKANYRDPLLNLAAKTLLLKTYIDLHEFDLLQSHLDAMRNYIHRKRVIGYHRTNYLNIIRFAEKAMRLSVGDKKETAALREAVQQEKVLTEKAFFLKILE